MNIKGIAASVLTVAILAGCKAERSEPEPEPAPEEPTQATPTPDASPVSILRPDVDQNEKGAPLSPLESRIGFPDGGSELNEAALAELATIHESPQMAEGGQIVLRGHSDANGTDDANIRASQSRAEAVRDWLVEKGVEQDRIRIIAFGEQNPVEPNALPDGEPNEAGRQANRRVDVTIRPPQSENTDDTDSEEPDESDVSS